MSEDRMTGVVPTDGPPSRTSRALAFPLIAALAAAALAGPRPATAGEAVSSQKTRHVWLDASGEPLPFQGHEKIEAFLRRARVVSREEIGIGINQMDKLLVEKEGVKAHAIFRDVDVEQERLRVAGRYYRRFKDDYASECAAYALSQLLRTHNVPPTVLRVLDGRSGSMQIWVENARDHAADDFSPPSAFAWVSQLWDMDFFDNLILNVDRNAGNILAGAHYRVWLIDHTRAFEPAPELLDPGRVQRISREVWIRLLEITEDELADATREYLDPEQVSALLKRRELLIEHVRALIKKRGRGVVLH